MHASYPCHALHYKNVPQVRRVGSDAPWRSEPLSHSDCLIRMLQNRGRICPLLEAPWVRTSIFRMDWLHVCDIGVCQDFAGNFFHEIMPLFPGNTKKEKCAAIFAELKADYDRLGIEDRMDCMLPTFFEHKDAAYKLRCSAAKARALPQIMYRLALEMLDANVPKYAALRQAAYHLSEVYAALSESHPCPADAMKEHGLKFALQYVALHDYCSPNDEYSFRIKPKLHLFLHLVSDGSVPRQTWTYRDEDFGGSVARMARRRGGQLSCKATSTTVLSRFKMKNPVIRFV
jgi:hypothetical protein